MTTLGAVLATLVDARLGALLAVPALALWRALSLRARLRARIWEAIDTVMSIRKTKPFD